MLFLKNKTIHLFCCILLTYLLAGCYKKDLEEFKKVNAWKYQPEIALPFVEKDITLADTIPTPPLSMTITMSDTASVELPGTKNQDTLESIIEHADFKVRLENTFPFNGVVQVYFADSNDVFIDSLLNNTERVMLPGAPVYTKDLVISVDKQRYINLTKKSSQMYLYYNLSTNNTTGLSNDYMRINIGMKAKLSLDLK